MGDATPNEGQLHGALKRAEWDLETGGRAGVLVLWLLVCNLGRRLLNFWVNFYDQTSHVANGNVK